MIEIGTTAQWKGQAYTLIAIRPYTRRRDGVSTVLLIWRSKCLDCGSDFEIVTGRGKIKNGELHWPNRRCPAHAKSGPRKRRA